MNRSEASTGPSALTIEVDRDSRSAFEQRIPGARTSITAVPIPGGSLNGARIEPFFMSATEVTWEQYLALVAGADDAPSEADAWSRPSKPYISMDRGFGQQTRPVISISYRGATNYADWLTATSGRAWRLPSAAEWEWAARAGSLGLPDFDSSAWHAGNSNGRTAPVGSLEPNAFGVFDLFGNAAEWIQLGAGRGALRGGCYTDDPGDLSPTRTLASRAAWNASDPQIPKSVWWLADAGFTGLRLVCETP